MGRYLQAIAGLLEIWRLVGVSQVRGYFGKRPRLPVTFCSTAVMLFSTALMSFPNCFMLALCFENVSSEVLNNGLHGFSVPLGKIMDTHHMGMGIVDGIKKKYDLHRLARKNKSDSPLKPHDFTNKFPSFILIQRPR
jgi:hypothetical protein